MSKSSLFGRLSRVLTRFDHERLARSGWKRRDFLRFTALAGGSVALGACSDDLELTSIPSQDEVRVAVVGAGLAGLHAAYRLKQAGVAVAVFEASSRVGGRTFTLRGEFPDAQIAEMGGELIDTNHTAMFALAEELGLALDDRQEDPPAVSEVWWVDGEAVPDATIVEQFSSVAERMLADLEAADEDEESYTELDETTLADYLDEVVPPGELPELHALLTSAYRGEFGLETPEQSALNLIYLIGSDEPDPFRVFGESDERYHLHGGSDGIASALADDLGGAVLLDRRLTRLEPASDGERMKLTFERKSGEQKTVVAEHVVLAIPFSVLRGLTLEVELSDDKRSIIDTLGYGTNAKVMGAFNERIWRTEHDASGAVTADRPFQQVWDSSIGQSGKHGILTNFLGGEQGVAVGDVDEQGWYESVVADLDAVFPGVTAAYVAGSARRMHWPSSPQALGSYTCYQPGQWSFWQLEGEREGNVHFCGEHTSPDFQGWMEGAAETGAFAAAEILNDLGLSYPPGLAAILAEKLPQPTWGLEEEPSARRAPLSRRRALSSKRTATG